MQKKGRTWLWTWLMAFSIISVCVAARAADKEVPSQDKVAKVAVVNGTVITQAQFDREFRLGKRRFHMGGKTLTDSNLSAIRKDTLERLIDAELLYQASQKKGIKASEADLDERLKKRFPDNGEFKKICERMNLSEAALKSQFLRGMAIQALIEQEIVQKIEVPEKEIKEYYNSRPESFKQPEQVQASHILIKVDPEAEASKKAEARKKIEDIQKKLEKGEDFSALAKEVSQCPSSAKGGDLGYFRRGQMVKPFEEVAFSLKPGVVSDIVETKFGYHLIKVEDKKSAATTPYEDVKEMILENLKREKVQKEVELYVVKLKEEAKVERSLGDVSE
ncbi:MAG: peptidylprolyl isomerase [Thermodesulfobacteriota bacterium]|nr:peptidylprolyl isomerase [Thermodesulfobacteriota bacterium]